MTEFDRALCLAENEHLALMDPETFCRKMDAELAQSERDGTGPYSDPDASPWERVEIVNKQQATDLKKRIETEKTFSHASVFLATTGYRVLSVRKGDTGKIFDNEREYEAHVNREVGLVR